MDCYCDHTNVWGDDSLLLDDDNTSRTYCEQCRNRMKIPTNDIHIESNLMDHDTGDSTIFINNPIKQYRDHFNSPDDSPLLSPSPILATDIIHCHQVCKVTEDESSLTKLTLAAMLCFLFMIAELIGGYLAGSLAIMTDAAHLFADLISFLMSIISIKLGKKPATKHMTFGYARSEVLGALFSILAIWLVAVIFLVLAIERLWTQDYEIEANTMIIVACLGLIINILMGAVLHGVCHSKALHNHQHDVENINVRAALAHVIGDLLQSIGVLIAAIVIKLDPTAKAADPICTILFTIFVIFVTRKVVKESVITLMESSPKDLTDILNLFKRLPGVKHVHSLHVWSIAPGKDALAVHLAVDENCDRDATLSQASLISKEKLKIASCTIQIEPFQETIMNECEQCRIFYR